MLFAVLMCQLLACVQPNIADSELNYYREQHGLPRWEISLDLQRSAYESARLIDSGERGWSHANYVERIEKWYGKEHSVVSENLARHYDTPQDAIEAWKRSGLHNAVLLQKSTCEYGFGQSGEVYVLHTGCK